MNKGELQFFEMNNSNNLEMEKAAVRMEELRKLINQYDYSYYVEAQPVVSDREYDALFRELQDLEKLYPALITEDSPTQRVGGEPLKEFASVIHEKPMLSLANTYKREEVEDFDKRVRNGLKDEEYRYVAELKFDGVALSIQYKNGLLSVAATRGDGYTGDDITQNMKTIRGLPLRVNEVLIHGRKLLNFEVRGEVYMTEKDFLKINEMRQEEGEKTFANPRNLTAGTLKLLDSRLIVKRPLRMITYFLDTNEIELKEHSKNLEYLKKLGFPVSEYSRICNNLDEVFEFIKEWETKRNELPFQIDGIVLKVDSIEQQNKLGMIARSPRWAIAFKYEAEKAETKLNDITLQVGRIGTVTPVAELEPVFLAGSTIKRATLHNADYIAELDIRIGDTVIVEKGGEVIPKVSGVVLEKRPEGTEPYQFPEFCPCEHHSRLIRIEGEANYYCNNPECPWQLRRRIEHFASRNAMNIEGLGEKVVEQFVKIGYIKNIADIYELHQHRDEMINLERWGIKSVDNLLEAIEDSKKQPLRRIIFALGIRFIGEGAAKLLANHFNSIDEIANSTEEELLTIHEIGNKMADSIVKFFQDPIEQDIIRRLKEYGLNMEKEKKEEAKIESELSGKTFVLTGELESMKRNEAKEKIESLGGKVTGSVSKNTSYVVTGSNPGSKYNNAMELGINILDEEAFLELIGQK